jgi:lipoprotein NlpD
MNWRAAWALVLVLASCATTPPARPRPRPGQSTHRVAAGENAYRIAKKYGTTVEVLAELNQLEDPESLAVGQVLILPGAAPAPPPPPPPGAPKDVVPPAPPPPVEALDEEERTLAEVKARLGREEAAPLAGCDGHPTGAKNKVASTGLIWPVDGVVVGKFGQRDGERHDGLDIGAPDGTPVWAAAAGEVIYSGEQSGYGLLVIVRHDDGRTTIYARNAKNCVGSGQKVDRGQVVALVGRSEGADAPYLHFELRTEKGPVNPRGHLP